MGTTDTISITPTAMEIAARHATVAGMSVDRWVDLLIQSQDVPWPDEGMDDMGFPSPRIPTDHQTKITNTLCHPGV